MKQWILLFFFSACSLLGQDTLVFRNGEKTTVKVNEIGINEIRYNRFDNLTGPQYVVEKNDVRYINYSNGQRDSFAISKPKQNLNAAGNFKTIEPSNEKIVIIGSKLSYKGYAVGEHRLLMMMNDLPQGDKKNKMRKAYEQMRQHKKNQYVVGFVGLGVGVLAPYIGFYASLFNGNSEFVPLGIGVLIGTGVGITGAAISSDQKRKRTLKKLEMARIYNE